MGSFPWGLFFYKRFIGALMCGDTGLSETKHEVEDNNLAYQEEKKKEYMKLDCSKLDGISADLFTKGVISFISMR